MSAASSRRRCCRSPAKAEPAPPRATPAACRGDTARSSMPPTSAASWRRRCSPATSAPPTQRPSGRSTGARGAGCGSRCRWRRHPELLSVPWEFLYRRADVPRRAAAPAAGPPRRGRADRRPTGDRRGRCASSASSPARDDLATARRRRRARARSSRRSARCTPPGGSSSTGWTGHAPAAAQALRDQRYHAIHYVGHSASPSPRRHRRGPAVPRGSRRRPRGAARLDDAGQPPR